MIKIKNKLAQAKSKISIKTYQKPLLYIMLMMIFINIGILTISAIIALYIDDSFTSFIDAFANGSLKWMLTPNAILNITNPKTLILAVFVLVIGLVLFSGVIIALTTNAIKEYIQKKNEGSGKIHLDQHIVILNWNSKVPELVSDLLYVESMDVTVIILADIDKSYAEKQIINAMVQTQKHHDISKMNVLVKKGDPLLNSDLEDISIQHAKSILIMNSDQHESVSKNMSKSDLNVIKIILSLGPIQFLYKPPIVVEIKHFETKDKINTLSKVVNSLSEHDIMPICFDKRLGQIIAQTLIENKIESIYLSLFSFQGSEVYVLNDMDIKSCLKTHSHAIPLAQSNKDLFVLSLNNRIKMKQSAHAYAPLKIKTKEISLSEDLKIYMLGHNNKLKFIIEAFDQYEKLHQSHFSAQWIDESKLSELIEALNDSNEKATLLLLSHEIEDNDALDANVINQLIYIEGHLTNRNTQIIVELLNPKNDSIVKGFSIKNTIISNKIISLLLSKLALFKETADFYENLLTIESNVLNEDHQSIVIKSAKDVFDSTFPIVFESKKQFIESIYISLDEKWMIIGYYHLDQLIMFENDLHQKSDLSIDEYDQLVLIKL